MQKIASKLVQVMQECAYVPKNGTNDFHHYSYATSADVLDKINDALTKQNICSIAVPDVVSIIDVTTAKGNIEHLATVKMNITLIDADSGEQLTITGLGSGQDSADKAAMKAQTAAIKYAYLLSMAISTGDDPEADSKTDEAASAYASISKAKGKANPAKKAAKPDYACSACATEISEKVCEYSIERHGQPLCMSCQRKAAA